MREIGYYAESGQVDDAFDLIRAGDGCPSETIETATLRTPARTHENTLACIRP